MYSCNTSALCADGQTALSLAGKGSRDATVQFLLDIGAQWDGKPWADDDEIHSKAAAVLSALDAQIRERKRAAVAAYQAEDIQTAAAMKAEVKELLRQRDAVTETDEQKGSQRGAKKSTSSKKDHRKTSRTNSKEL